ncbi:hypothetical protein [uncultured Maribacter sp.]|uniref:hypothetical protein n=1 Tax=uncultured Maribacter sp. TaxID=431308 RepID=UPI00261EB677|nr:hypothetical protein [uncultured Maribacter sp.]
MNVVEQPITDESFIQNLIPQKWPFVMVDTLFYFSAEKIISGFKIKKEDLFSSNGYFQGPGLIENMAQTVALHTGYSYFLKNQEAPTGYIGSIKKAEIIKLPKEGQELKTTVVILHDIMGVTLVKIEVECEGEIIALSEMKTVLAK